MIRRDISFSKPFITNADLDEISAELRKVLLSGWLTSGSMVENLEKEFAGIIGSKHATALNSCTAALHTILLSLGIKSGDEVLVPSNTFVATANAALYVGAKPVFADSDPETFNVSSNEVQSKLSKKTKAVVVVHLGGNPCNMKEINEIVEDYNIPIIEDAAHAHGAKYRDRNCGTIGVAGAFSFYPTKIVTTAEGGMITTDREDLAVKAKVIRNHGRATYGPAEIVELGFNYRLSEIHAVIGISQLKHIRGFIKQRSIIAAKYSEALSQIPWLVPQHVENGNLCSYYAYLVKLSNDAPITRDELIQDLKSQGVATSIMYNPVHLQPFYAKSFGYKKGTLPVAEELGERSLALPIYNGMSIEDAHYVIEAIKHVVEKMEN